MERLILKVNVRLSGKIVIACLWCMFQIIIAHAQFTRTATYDDSVKVYSNLRYAVPNKNYLKDGSSDRTMDLYYPLWNKTSEAPIVLFIHGGGFRTGDKVNNSLLYKNLCKRGYAVLSVNYRLKLKNSPSSDTTIKELSRGIPSNGIFNAVLKSAIITASQDVQLALKWIVKNAVSYHLDTSSVAIGGGSAGAITALYLAYASGQQVLLIKAVINCWGAMENTRSISPHSASIITFHGDRDRLINVEFAYAIDSAMKQKGNMAETNILAGKGHSEYALIANEKVDEIDRFLKRAFRR